MRCFPNLLIGAFLLLVPLGSLSGDPAPGPDVPTSPAQSTEQTEIARERDHPYFTLADLSKAQELAHKMHWPLAWIDGNLNALNRTDAPPGSEDELTQIEVNYLKSRVVIIFLDASTDLSLLSPVIRDQQLFQMDDGTLPNGHHFYVPKIAFSDADVTKALGRVSYTQMSISHIAAINAVLTSIASDPKGGFQINIGDPTSDIAPSGKTAVTLSSFTNPPTSGVQFDQTTDAMKQNGLSSDDIVVACDGTQVENTEQYTATRDASDSPSMKLIIWDGQSYRELNVNQPGRRFGVEMHDYKP